MLPRRIAFTLAWALVVYCSGERFLSHLSKPSQYERQHKPSKLPLSAIKLWWKSLPFGSNAESNFEAGTAGLNPIPWQTGQRRKNSATALQIKRISYLPFMICKLQVFEEVGSDRNRFLQANGAVSAKRNNSLQHERHPLFNASWANVMKMIALRLGVPKARQACSHSK